MISFIQFHRLFRVSAVGLVLFTTSAYAITLTTTNDVRVLANGPNSNYAYDSALALFNNGDNVQRTWINFDLSPYFIP